jgi:CRP/FNR family transcriptional regulator, polysaccharide utilization system transcription regulator
MNKQSKNTDCKECESRGGSIFCSLHSDELDSLNSAKGVITFSKGEVIFKQGGFPNGLYCLGAGKVKITHEGEDGKEVITRVAGPGDTIGYRALLSGDRYRSSAVAIDDTAVCFVPKNVLYDLITHNSSMSFSVMKLLADALKNAEVRITGLAHRPVRERMAEALLLLKEKYGCSGKDNVLNVTLSREELAYLAGTVRESATKMLSEFKDDGIIEFDGKKIRITDVNLLQKRANLTD